MSELSPHYARKALQKGHAHSVAQSNALEARCLIFRTAKELRERRRKRREADALKAAMEART